MFSALSQDDRYSVLELGKALLTGPSYAYSFSLSVPVSQISVLQIVGYQVQGPLQRQIHTRCTDTLPRCYSHCIVGSA